MFHPIVLNCNGKFPQAAEKWKTSWSQLQKITNQSRILGIYSQVFLLDKDEHYNRFKFEFDLIFNKFVTSKHRKLQ